MNDLQIYAIEMFKLSAEVMREAYQDYKRFSEIADALRIQLTALDRIVSEKDSAYHDAQKAFREAQQIALDFNITDEQLEQSVEAYQ